jgi:hypothetical protein
MTMLNDKDDGLDLPTSLKRAAPPPAPAPTVPVGNGNGKATTTTNDAPKPKATTPAMEPEVQQAAKSTPAKKAKATPAKKAPAAKKPTPKAKAPAPKKLVAVTDIAKEYGLVPREARALLRAAKLKKPAVGWAYAKDDAALKRVREVLKAGKGK